MNSVDHNDHYNPDKDDDGHYPDKDEYGGHYNLEFLIKLTQITIPIKMIMMIIILLLKMMIIT